MARVKRGTLKTKKRRKILKLTKGYKWGRKKLKRAAKEAVLHAFTHAYQGRKQKKRDFRRVWQVRLNAALREKGLKYSAFIHQMKRKNIKLNRKVLSELAYGYSDVFDRLVEEIINA
jgi:large subunit ribosomal protein L20